MAVFGLFINICFRKSVLSAVCCKRRILAPVVFSYPSSPIFSYGSDGNHPYMRTVNCGFVTCEMRLLRAVRYIYIKDFCFDGLILSRILNTE